MKLDTKEFIKLLVDAEYEPRSYSGRGMFGESCIGIITDDQGFEVGMKIAQVLFNRYLFSEEQFSDNNPPIMPDDIMEFIGEDIKSDNIVLRYIIYFPAVKCTKEVQDILNELEDQKGVK